MVSGELKKGKYVSLVLTILPRGILTLEQIFFKLSSVKWHILNCLSEIF